MPGNEVVITVRGDTRNLEGAMDRAVRSVRGGAQQMSARLRSIRGPLIAVTGMLGAAGGGAIKMATSFETSMQKIVGLVGIAQDEVDQMRQGVLALSGQTARSPQELADALFFVTSAGQRGEEAMATLEAAARASAAGLGTTKDVALTVVGALQSYKTEGLTAAEATDILTATVRAGNLEASELAGSLSRIIPVAQSAGVSLEEVGGAVSLVSRTGAPTAEVVTGLRAAILQMSAITQRAAGDLEDMGISGAQLRETLAEEGLIAALRAVQDVVGNDNTAFRKVLGSVEALNVAQTLLSASSEDIASTFGETANAAGVMDEAFGVAADTSGFKFQQALNETKIAAVEFGEVMLPVVRSVISGLTDLLGVFTGLSPEVRTLTTIVGGAALALSGLGLLLPPLITGFGAVVTAAKGAFIFLAATNPVILAIGGITAAVVALVLKWDAVTGAVRGAVKAIASGSDDLTRSLEDLNRPGGPSSAWSLALRRNAEVSEETTTAMLGNVQSLARGWAEGNVDIGEANALIEEMTALNPDLANKLSNTWAAFGDADEAAALVNQASNELAHAADITVTLDEQVRDLAVSMAAMAQGTDAAAVAYDEALSEALRKTERETRRAEQAFRDYIKENAKNEQGINIWQRFSRRIDDAAVALGEVELATSQAKAEMAEFNAQWEDAGFTIGQQFGMMAQGADDAFDQISTEGTKSAAEIQRAWKQQQEHFAAVQADAVELAEWRADNEVRLAEFAWREQEKSFQDALAAFEEAEAEKVRIAEEATRKRIADFAAEQLVMARLAEVQSAADVVLKVPQREAAMGRLAEALTPEEAISALLDVGRLRAQVLQARSPELQRAGGLSAFELPEHIAGMIGLGTAPGSFLDILRDLGQQGTLRGDEDTLQRFVDLAEAFTMLNPGRSNPFFVSGSGSIDDEGNIIPGLGAGISAGGGILPGLGSGTPIIINFNGDTYGLADFEQAVAEALVTAKAAGASV